MVLNSCDNAVWMVGYLSDDCDEQCFVIGEVADNGLPMLVDNAVRHIYMYHSRTHDIHSSCNYIGEILLNSCPTEGMRLSWLRNNTVRVVHEGLSISGLDVE